MKMSGMGIPKAPFFPKLFDIPWWYTCLVWEKLSSSKICKGRKWDQQVFVTKKLSMMWWLMNRTGGLAFLWFTVVQVTTQLVGLVYLSAQPQNYLPDVFPQSITHNSKPDIWVSSYITHVLLIYACVSIMRDICRDNHRCADRAYVSWAPLLSGSVFRHHQFTTTCILTSRLIFIHLNPRTRFDNCIVLYCIVQIQLDIIALQVLRLTTTPRWSQLQQQLTQPGLVEVNKLIMSKSGTTAAATNSG